MDRPPEQRASVSKVHQNDVRQNWLKPKPYRSTTRVRKKWGQHLTIEERKSIERLLLLGIDTTAIARNLGLARSTIQREYKRCGSKKTYTAKQAHEHYLMKIRNSNDNNS